MLYFSPHLINASALPYKTDNMEIESFHIYFVLICQYWHVLPVLNYQWVMTWKAVEAIEWLPDLY